MRSPSGDWVKDVVIGRGHNRKEVDQDPTAHAEIIAIRRAACALGRWRLDDVTLYCTLEPCPMCAGAMVLARIGGVVYGADDPKAGAAGSVIELLRDPRLNHQVAVTRGVLRDQAETLLQTSSAQRVPREMDWPVTSSAAFLVSCIAIRMIQIP